MTGNNIAFTLRTRKGALLEFKGNFVQDELILRMAGIEDHYGTYTLARQEN
jgi:hypothetical protein